MVEISWFVSLMTFVSVVVTLTGVIIFFIGIFSEKGLRWTGIGLLLMFLLLASITRPIIGKAEVLGVPIKLENLHKDKVFSVVEMLGKSEKSQDYKDLALIKEASCDDKKQKCARIVAVTLSGLPAPGKSFFLKKIDGKITVFPVPNP